MRITFFLIFYFIFFPNIVNSNTYAIKVKEYGMADMTIKVKEYGINTLRIPVSDWMFIPYDVYDLEQDNTKCYDNSL